MTDLLYQVTDAFSGMSELQARVSSARSPTRMRVSWRGWVIWRREGVGDEASFMWTLDEDVIEPMQFVASQV